MKKKMITLVSLIAAFIMMFTLAGCNKDKPADVSAANANKEKTTVVSPVKNDKKDKDDYKEILAGLKAGSAYAYADIGKEHKVLLVTDAPMEFDGKLEAARATVYGYDKNGNVKNYGSIESTSTSMPLMANGSYIYFGSHHSMSRARVDEQNSKLIVETAKEGDKKYDSFFNGYADGNIVKFTAVKKDAAKEKEVTNEEMEFISPDGWRVRYDAKSIAATEVDKHTAQFVYQGEAAGTCMAEIKYIADKQPEEVLYDVTSEWGDQSKIQRSEGTFPGTDDKLGYWRVLPDNGKGSRLSMTAIATEYNDGVLLAVETFHSSGKDEIDMAASDALAEVIDSITFKNFKEQKMHSYVAGTYKAADKDAKYTSVILKKDYTGVLTDSKGKKHEITWGSTELKAKDGNFTYSYTIEGDNLYLQLDNDGDWIEYAK